MPMIAQTPVLAQPGRDLTQADIALMAVTKVGSETPKLKRIRAVHHAAARLLATGMKAAEVSLTTGLCASRLSILQNDPAFTDLMSHYASQEEDRFAVVQDRMVMLGLVAADELQERIIENPEDVATRDLTEILRHSLDRGGHAPLQRRETKTTLGIDANTLAAIKQSASEVQNGRVFHRRPEKTLPASAGTIGESSLDGGGAVAGAEKPARLTLKGIDL